MTSEPTGSLGIRAAFFLNLALLALIVGFGSQEVAVGVGVGEPVLSLEPEPRRSASDYRLRVEHWAEPRVSELRRRENLDAVVGGASGELEVFTRLMSWTNAQWSVGNPEPYPGPSALDILDDIRAGRTSGFCAQYAFVLADALKSFGYWSVRTLELETVAGEGHVVVEVFSGDVNGWVVLDPTFDIRYESVEGRPLSALALHRHYWDGLPVRVVMGTAPRRPGQSPQDTPRGGIDRYARIAVALRSDFAHLERPLTMGEREMMFLRWDGGAGRGETFEHLAFRLSTSRPGDLNPPVGQIYIEKAELEHEQGGAFWSIEVSTRGTWPHFRSHEMRLDGGPWVETPSTIRLDATMPHHVELRAVNVGAVPGPTFKLSVPARA